MNDFYSIWSHCPFCGGKLDESTYYDETIGECLSCDLSYSYQYFNDFCTIAFHGFSYEFPDFTINDAQYINMRIYQEGGRPDWVEFRYFTIKADETESEGVPF